MKTWTWILLPFLFLGGLMLGRWSPAPSAAPPVGGRRGGQPRDALAAPRATAALSPVTGMLRIPDRVEPRANAPRDTEAPAEDATPETERRRRRGPPAWAEQMEGETLRERIEWAADAWRLRTDIVRDAFLAEAGLTRNEAAQFDVLMHAMNLRLTAAVSAWVEDLAVRDTVTPEDGVRLMHGLTDALVVTYDEMDRTLPDTWRTAAGSRFDLVTFVDPSVAMPLVGIEDRFDRAVRGSR